MAEQLKFGNIFKYNEQFVNVYVNNLRYEKGNVKSKIRPMNGFRINFFYARMVLNCKRTSTRNSEENLSLMILLRMLASWKWQLFNKNR